MLTKYGWGLNLSSLTLLTPTVLVTKPLPFILPPILASDYSQCNKVWLGPEPQFFDTFDV